MSPFTNEETEMNKIADILIPLLVKDGRLTVKRNSPSMGIYQVAADSNNFKADIHIAIHSNSGGGVGTEVFAYGPKTNSERLAQALHNQIAPLSPGNDRGVKFNPRLVEVGNMVGATAALIELGFHDNQSDATWMAYNHPMIAQALYNGICDFFGHAYVSLVVTPAIDPPVPSTVDKDIYLSVRVLQSRSEQAMGDINKLGFAAKVLLLA